MDPADTASSPTHSVPPFDTPTTLGFFIVTIIFPLLATAAIALRFYSKRISHFSWSLDDWLILAAFAANWCFCIMQYLSMALGRFGHHMWQLTPSQNLYFNKHIIAIQYVYCFTIGFSRLSIIWFLNRLFYPKRWFRFATYSLFALNVTWLVYAYIIISFICIPFSKNWNRSEPGHCLDLAAILNSWAIWGLVIEVLIWALPIALVWNLNLPNRHKYGLTAIFGLGMIDIIIGILRVVSNAWTVADDVSYTVVPAAFLAVIEPAISIVVVCTPLYRPLIDRGISRIRQLSFDSASAFLNSRRPSEAVVEDAEKGAGDNSRGRGSGDGAEDPEDEGEVDFMAALRMPPPPQTAKMKSFGKGAGNSRV